jgi:cytochrome c-type biogenesis protein CcmE
MGMHAIANRMGSGCREGIASRLTWLDNDTTIPPAQAVTLRTRNTGDCKELRMRTKLLLCGTLITASIGYAVYLGASSSWQYYLQVDECLAQADQFRGKRLRLSGRVAADSLKASPEYREASFVLEGNVHRLQVRYRGTIPDNLAEGREVVVEGTLIGDDHFECETLITRCASKYAPKDAGNAREQARKGGAGE